MAKSSGRPLPPIPEAASANKAVERQVAAKRAAVERAAAQQATEEVENAAVEAVNNQGMIDAGVSQYRVPTIFNTHRSTISRLIGQAKKGVNVKPNEKCTSSCKKTKKKEKERGGNFN